METFWFLAFLLVGAYAISVRSENKRLLEKLRTTEKKLHQYEEEKRDEKIKLAAKTDVKTSLSEKLRTETVTAKVGTPVIPVMPDDDQALDAKELKWEARPVVASKPASVPAKRPSAIRDRDADAFERIAKSLNVAPEPAPAATAPRKTQTVTASKPRTEYKPKFLVAGLDFAMQGPKGLLSLFYLGAFFVIVAAIIFVNSSWIADSPALKSLVLIAVTLAFAAGGYLLARDRRLRVAGIVYAGIALIFIPIDGIAYYNFTRALGNTDGSVVWMMASLAFVGLSYLYYRSVMKNQLMYQFILAGVLSTMWSLVHIVDGELVFYALATTVYGYILYFAAKKAKVNEHVLQVNGRIFALAGAIVGYVCQLPVWSQSFQAFLAQPYGIRVTVYETLAWSTNWLLPVFVVAALGFLIWRFVDERRDSAWNSFVIGFLILVATILELSQAGANVWCATMIVLAYCGLLLIWDKNLLGFLTESQRQIIHVLTPILLLSGSIIGTSYSIYTLADQWQSDWTLLQKWAIGYPAALFSACGLIYFVIRHGLWRREIDLLGVGIWLPVVMNVILGISEASFGVGAMAHLAAGVLAYIWYWRLADNSVWTISNKAIIHGWSTVITTATCIFAAWYYLERTLGVGQTVWAARGLAVLYLLAGTGYYLWRYVAEPSVINLAATEIGVIATLAATLGIGEVPRETWGWSFYLLTFVIAALGLVKTELLPERDREFLRTSATTLLAFTTWLLFTLGYHGEIREFPFLFALMPLLYLLGRSLITPQFGWRLATLLWGIVVLMAGLWQMSAPVEAWGWAFYLLAFGLLALGYLPLSLIPKTEQTFWRAGATIMVGLTTLCLYSVGYEFDVIEMPLLFFFLPLIYLVLRIYLDRSFIWKAATLFWVIILVMVVLVKVDAPVVTWGWSFYLLSCAVAALGLRELAFVPETERFFWRAAGTTLLALTTAGLYAIGYEGDVIEMPLLFFLMPLGYFLVRMYTDKVWGWRLAAYVWTLVLGMIALDKLDFAGQIHLQTWYYAVWAQSFALATLAWSLHRQQLSGQRERNPLTAIYGLTVVGATVVLATMTVGRGQANSLTTGQIWQLSLYVADILMAYWAANLYLTGEDKYLNISFLWIVGWWLLAGDLRLDSIQWFVQPVAYYLFARVIVRHGQGRHTARDIAIFAATACISAFIWRALSEDIGILMAILTGVGTLIVGYWWREQVLRRIGVAIAVIVVFLMFAATIFSLPAEFWLAVIGISLLAVATISLRRHQK